MPGSVITADAVIFDLDGVLIDSEPAHYAAEVELLARYGKQLDRDTWQAMKGLTDAGFFAALEQHGLAPPISAVQLAREKLTIMRRILPSRAAAFPQAVAVVRSLRARPLALATSSSRSLTALALRLLDLEQAFDAVVTGDDVARGKPHPEPFLLAARRLGVPAERCVVIEDSVNGVRAALAAGMACIAVAHSFAGEDLAAATRVVPRVADVPAVLADLA